jgi:RNA polymerase sigma factor (TIGR02999 family)
MAGPLTLVATQEPVGKRVAGGGFPVHAPASAARSVSDGPEPEITDVLLAWGDGDAAALERLIPLVVDELRRAARRFLERESPGHTLQPTALVNELYLRLAGRRRVSFQNRAHFFGFAAQTMRRILVDYARARQTAKRGHRPVRVALDDLKGVAIEEDLDLVRLDDALATLAAMDPRQGRVVELRFFAGLSLEEIADVLGVGVATVGRDWACARAWLFRELRMR